MKTGLVLEGGAMRGMYTAGVLDIFLEQGIRADCVVGVSAGALFGVNYLSGQKGRVIRYCKRFNPDPHYLGLLPLLREGNIVSTKYAYNTVPHVLDPFDDEAFMASKIPFYAVVTDIATGEPEYIPIESVFRQMDTLRASGSMPFVSRPVSIGGRQYLDGGISDSIPFRWMARQGADRQIVVLTQCADYRKKPLPAALLKTYGLLFPAISRRLAGRHNSYNADLRLLREWEAQGKVFVIRPSEKLRVHKTDRDPNRLQAAYDLGRRDAAALLPALQKFLAQPAGI